MLARAKVKKDVIARGKIYCSIIDAANLKQSSVLKENPQMNLAPYVQVSVEYIGDSQIGAVHMRADQKTLQAQ